MGYIYKITNIINNKVYIGKTSKTIEKRFEEHKKKASEYSNRHLYNAMNFYGIDNFQIEQIESCPNDQLNKKEIYWISFFDSTNSDKGYNLTLGGDGGNTWKLNSHKIETGELIRQKQLKEKYIPITKEQLEKDIEENLTLQQIAKKYHAGHITISNRIKFFFGKSLEELRNTPHNYKEIDKNNFLLDIKEGKMTCKEIGIKYNISTHTVTSKCKELTGKTPSELWKEQQIVRPGMDKIKISKEEIILFFQQGKNIKEIAEYYNIAPDNLSIKIKKIFGKNAREVKKDYA